MIKTAFEEECHYLEGAQYTVKVYTYHKNIEYLHKTRALNQQQLRWALFFSHFDFMITYHLGTENSKADALFCKGGCYKGEESTNQKQP